MSPSPIPVTVIESAPTAWQWLTQFAIPLLGVMGALAVGIAAWRVASIAKDQANDLAKKNLAYLEAKDKQEQAAKAAADRRVRAKFARAAEHAIEDRKGWTVGSVWNAAGARLNDAASECGWDADVLAPWLMKEIGQAGLRDIPGKEEEYAERIDVILERVSDWVESGTFDSEPLPKLERESVDIPDNTRGSV